MIVLPKLYFVNQNMNSSFIIDKLNLNYYNKNMNSHSDLYLGKY